MTRLTKEKVLALQKAVAKRTGGEGASLDAAALEAALAAPFARGTDGADVFPSREEKAAKRVFGADGARMAMAVTLVFLEANGLSVDAPQDEVVITARALVNRRLRYDDLLAWICRHAT